MTVDETAAPPRPRTPPFWWVLFGLGLIVAAAGAIVWLGATNAPGGRPLIENPGGIIAVLVGGVLSLSAVILPKLNSIRDATAATQHHVVNDHGDRVLRDDMDELLRIARSTEARVEAVEGTQADLRADIGGLRQENRDDRRADQERFALVEGRVRDLEHREKP